jgi:hypothetical protein
MKKKILTIYNKDKIKFESNLDKVINNKKNTPSKKKLYIDRKDILLRGLENTLN